MQHVNSIRSAVPASALAFAILAGCGGSKLSINSDPPLLDTGIITNRVWLDADRNGIQDSGEAGIPGVKVTLMSASGTREEQTDANGLAKFDELGKGTYVVKMEVPEGCSPTLTDVGSDDSLDSDPNPSTIVLSSRDSQNHDVDFGLFAGNVKGQIGDFVWHDLDRDGIQDPGEPGLNGIRVFLKDAAGNTLDEEVTGTSRAGALGHFLFQPLVGGTYTIEVDTTTLPPKFSPSPCDVGNDRTVDSNCSPATVQIGKVASEDVTIDFGFFGDVPCSGVIGDFVWLDKNGDGCQDPGEPGIGMVDVILSQAGRKIRETTTDSRGRYEFKKVCAGTYTVAIDVADLPPCVTASPKQACNDPVRDSNGSPATVILIKDDTVDRTIDFGFAPTEKGRITGRVWDDKNKNGLQDPSEPGRTDIRILLRDTSARILEVTRTTAKGYAFEGLCPGEYIVEVDTKTLPSSSKPSPCRVGNDRTIDNDCSPVTVEVPTNGTVAHIDFGYFTTVTLGSIGDFVWDDRNCNGLQDRGEPGIAGIVIVLRDSSGRVLERQRTNQFGQYVFDLLPAGRYRVEYDPNSVPSCRKPSPCDKGSNRAIDSNCSPATVVLAAGQNDKTIDFGFFGHCKFKIGDFVWVDTDRDGIQDSNEHGLESVKIILKDAQGKPIATTFSDENGRYEFDKLAPATYSIEYDPASIPTGMQPSPIGVGSDRGKDSNRNPSRVVLSTGDDTTIDFGFQPKKNHTGHQGCSTSFWRKNLGKWPIQPTTLFRAYFDDRFPGKTMLQVISGSGGGLDGLGRDTVAALLNSESSKVRYALTTAEIQSLFNRLVKGSSKEHHALKHFFERLNKLGCPLD